MDRSKVFRGYRFGLDLEVRVEDEEGAVIRALPWRVDEYNASPTGLECGYSGAGPTQLAFSLLREVGYSVEEARSLCFFVRDSLVRHLPRDGSWVVREEDVKAAAGK